MHSRRPFNRKGFRDQSSYGIAPNSLDTKYFHYGGNIAIFSQDIGYACVFCDFHTSPFHSLVRRERSN